MTDPPPSEITRLLREMEHGQPGAADALVPLVYDELHRLADRALQRENPGHTLQPTALVHEAFLVLVGQRSANWRNRTHFYRMAARLMRRILVDHARRRLAAKRGGGLRVTLDDSLNSGEDRFDERLLDVIAIEDAMTRLEALDARPARVVELRFFAGFDVEETARALEVSTASVVRDWAFARAFLKRELATGEVEP
jgi:RNA polymerase sigma factor (TIGR02999 family)